MCEFVSIASADVGETDISAQFPGVLSRAHEPAGTDGAAMWAFDLSH